MLAHNGWDMEALVMTNDKTILETQLDRIEHKLDMLIAALADDDDLSYDLDGNQLLSSGNDENQSLG